MDPIISAIEKAGDILIVCHVRPDGDCLGAGFALHNILCKLRKNADFVCCALRSRALLAMPFDYLKLFLYADGVLPTDALKSAAKCAAELYPTSDAICETSISVDLSSISAS